MVEGIIDFSISNHVLPSELQDLNHIQSVKKARLSSLGNIFHTVIFSNILRAVQFKSIGVGRNAGQLVEGGKQANLPQNTTLSRTAIFLILLNE